MVIAKQIDPKIRMSRKNKPETTSPPTQADEVELRYEPNRKHKEPWQPGRKGSLCPPPAELSLSQATRMLRDSVLDGKKRYAHHAGKAYVAQEHQGGWHGYPVGWVEVPASIWLNWLSCRQIRKQDLRRHWESTN
jgi:hypothetical protein